MSDASCPFCGTSIISTVHPAHATCCLASYGFTNEQWNMRPPKKEQPAQSVTSEVEYLRQLVRDLVVKPTDTEIEALTKSYSVGAEKEGA